MKLIAAGAMVAMVLSAEAAAAQDVPPPPPKASPVPPRKVAGDHDITLGLAYHGPTRLTGSATFMWGHPRMLIAWAPAKLAQVRVGAGGAQIGLGLAAGVFEESAWRPSGIAVTIKAIGIQTWREPEVGLERGTRQGSLSSGHSYAGFESDIVLLGIRGSVGYARKVAGRGGPDNRFVWSLGLGL